MGRPEFTDPEILRTNLASVILQMAAVGLGDIQDFPFLEPPETRTIRDGIAPPTINLDTPGEGCDLDFVPHTAREMPITAAVSNSFGFGGTNGSLVLARFES